MARPVWSLDVDGVINVARPGWGAAPRNGSLEVAGLPYPMRWAPGLVRRIRALHDTRAVHIRWCSTWCDHAEQVERLFGLPSLDRAWWGEIIMDGVASAKLAAARAVLAEGRRLIWTDDAEVPTAGPVREELTGSGDALLIAPSPVRGLQPDDLDAIEDFLAAGPVGTDDDPPGGGDEEARRWRRALFGDRFGQT